MCEWQTRTRPTDPTVPGYYWAKWYGDGDWEVVFVRQEYHGLSVYKIACANELRLNQFTWGPRIESHIERGPEVCTL